MAPEPDPTTTSSRPRPSDEEVLIPSREVKLTNGTRVLVEPWGMKKGALVLARLEGMSPHLWKRDPHTKQPVGFDAAGLLSSAWDEVVGLIELTLPEVTRAEMEREPRDGGWLFEDVLAVTSAVLEVCVLRSDGGGALPLLVSLIGQATELVTRSLGPDNARRVQTRSNGSGAAGTSTVASPTGSDSRAPKRRAAQGHGKKKD